jgi:ATP-binding cassette subfamily B protein
MSRRRHRPTRLSAALPGLGRVGRALAPFLMRQRALAGSAVLALLGATAMRLLEPWPLKFVIDGVLGAGTGTPAGMAPTTLLALCVAALVGVLGLRALLSYLATVALALAGQRALSAVREALFEHLQRLSPRFHQRMPAGDLTLRLTGDVGMLRDTLVTAALPLAANVLVVVGMLAVMAWLDWRLALVALAPLPLLALGGRRVGRRIQEVGRAQRQREGAMAAVAAEALSAVRLVQALGLHGRAASVFTGASRRSLKEGAKAARLSAGLERGTDALVALATAAVLGFGALRVLDGTLTPGELLVFLTYLKNTLRPVREYAKYTARLAKASAAGERVVDLLETAPEVVDGADATPAPVLSGALRFEGLRFGYTSGGAPVLDGLDLAVAPGELVAITGPSGAGKSTLAALLLRLHEPDAGCIRVDGVELPRYTADSLRAQIAFVPQDNALFAGTLGENIALAAGRPVSAAEIEQAARLARAHDFISALPQGYDTAVGERGATLSAGQRQRIAVARAALRHAPLLVLDEPTVGLDRDNEQAVVEALLVLARGRTTLLVTHDLALAARADRIVVIDAGQVREQGSHDALLARGGLYAALWRCRPVAPAGVGPGPVAAADSPAPGTTPTEPPSSAPTVAPTQAMTEALAAPSPAGAA